MDLQKIEKLLRQIPTQSKILNHEKRVQIITSESITATLKEKLSAPEIQKVLTEALAHDLIRKAVLVENSEHCSFNLQKYARPGDNFFWLKEKGNLMNFLLALLCIIASLALAMYQVWPKSVRGYTIYVAYAMIGFLAFMLILGIIRLVVFAITFFSHPPGIWIFPNLFADVGFVESFIPLYAYHVNEDRKGVKNEKGEDVSPEAGEQRPSSKEKKNQ